MTAPGSAAGRAVPDDPALVLAPPDWVGHGTYGLLDDDGATVACHECGRRFRILGQHVNAAHGLSAVDYRRVHGLGVLTALVSTDHQ